ncbi:MAG: GNAT family N-acetyltransferase [Clostridiales bacterium]|nr:GNAT family N-acetyltransferase [Clostridiales bacterium]
MIRPATEADIAPIAETYTQLLTHEAKVGSTSNWQLNVYPTIKVPQEKVAAGEMYVLEADGEIGASMVLNREQAAEFSKIPWAYDAQPDHVLVIHTLCIPPRMARRGYGRAMVDYAKEFAREQGCTVIRIDTYAHNEPAKAMYTRNGFRIAAYHHALLEGLVWEEMAYLECQL